MASASELCAFCREDGDVGGEILVEGDLMVHQHCLYFASGLAQNGVEQSNTINGFLLEDIRQELRRGLRITCSGCHKAGGYVGCAVKTCRKAGHFPCLQRLGYTLQYSENFKAYCPSHRPTQPKLRHSKDSTECCICLSHFTPGNRIYCPCCLTVFHKTCVEKQAWSAGLYHLRCAVCKNKETYCNEMLRMGIAIPERDALWEVGTDYAEEDPKYCHAELCLCPEGRSHSTQIGQYRMRKCRTCGQCRGHVDCLRADQTNECKDCSTAPHVGIGSGSTVTNETKESGAMGTPATVRDERTRGTTVRGSSASATVRGSSTSVRQSVMVSAEGTEVHSTAASSPVLRRKKRLVLSLKKLNSKDISLINTSSSS